MREKPNKRCVICRLASQRWNEMLARRLTTLRQSIVRHHRRKRITPGGNADQNETSNLSSCIAAVNLRYNIQPKRHVGIHTLIKCTYTSKHVIDALLFK